MGSIYQRRDGRFEGRFKDKGENKTHYFYGRSEGEVRQKIDDFRSSRTYGETDLTVKMLFEEWFKSRQLRVKESTLANYWGKAKTHILPAFGDRRVQDLTEADIREFILEKLSGSLSAGYVADIVILLKAVIKFAVMRYRIRDCTEEIILPKKRRTSILLLTGTQQEHLQKYIGGHPDLTSLGVALSLFTGLRIGELCALRWSDLNLTQKRLSVSRTIQRIHMDRGTKLVITEPKSASSVRIIPIPDCLVPMLARFRQEGTAYVLSGTEKPVEPRLMQYRFHKLLQKASLPSIHFHALRHMFATNCVELGFDIKALSEILGHSGVEITLNLYVHSSLERKEQFMRMLRFAA